MEDQNAKELHEHYPEYSDGGEGVLQEPEISPMDRVLYVVTAPKRAFEGLLSTEVGAVVGWGLLVSVILSVVMVVIMQTNDAYIEVSNTVQQEKMAEVLNNPDLTDEQRESMEDSMGMISSPTFLILAAVLGVAILVPIMMVLAAVLVFIIAKILESGRESYLRFSHAMAVTSLGFIVSVLGSLVLTVISLLTDPAVAVNQSGLAGLLNVDTPALAGVINGLSPNMLWYYAVTGLGIASIARTSWLKGAIIFGAIMTVLTIGLSMLGKMATEFSF